MRLCIPAVHSSERNVCLGSNMEAVMHPLVHSMGESSHMPHGLIPQHLELHPGGSTYILLCLGGPLYPVISSRKSCSFLWHTFSYEIFNFVSVVAQNASQPADYCTVFINHSPRAPGIETKRLVSSLHTRRLGVLAEDLSWKT